MNDSSQLDPRLKELIDRVIVPALVKEYLAQSHKSEVPQPQVNERRDSSLKSPGTQNELNSEDWRAKELLRVAEAAAALSIKEATLRAWILKRKITYAKLGRVIRIPTKEIQLLIDRSTVPSR